jgi:hypothetical protein
LFRVSVDKTYEFSNSNQLSLLLNMGLTLENVSTINCYCGVTSGRKKMAKRTTLAMGFGLSLAMCWLSGAHAATLVVKATSNESLITFAGVTGSQDVIIQAFVSSGFQCNESLLSSFAVDPGPRSYCASANASMTLDVGLAGTDLSWTSGDLVTNGRSSNRLLQPVVKATITAQNPTLDLAVMLSSLITSLSYSSPSNVAGQLTFYEPQLLTANFSLPTYYIEVAEGISVASVNDVPVPAALPLLISGFAALGLLGRRKRSKVTNAS